MGLGSGLEGGSRVEEAHGDVLGGADLVGVDGADDVVDVVEVAQREGALGAALAGVHVREVAAEAPLVHGLGEGPLRVGRLCLF